MFPSNQAKWKGKERIGIEWKKNFSNLLHVTLEKNIIFFFISKVFFGTYRLTASSQRHALALLLLAIPINTSPLLLCIFRGRSRG